MKHLLPFLLLFPLAAHAAEPDSLTVSSADSLYQQAKLKEERGLAMEGITDAIGAAADQLFLDKEFLHHPTLARHRTGSAADYAVAATPLAATWIMKAAGVPSRSSTRRLLLSNALSMGMISGFTSLVKYNVNQPRPDFSDNHTLPSGHTALAFASASILHREYGYLSPWVSWAGYATASLTDMLCIKHNTHWPSDISMGKAIGLLSTNLSYFITDRILRGKDDISTVGWDTRNRLLREHVNDRPTGLAVVDAVEGGATTISSEDCLPLTDDSQFSLKSSSAKSVGLDFSYFMTDNFALQALFRHTDAFVKAYAEQPRTLTGGHLQTFHYDMAFLAQHPLWLPPFLSFILDLLPPTLMSAHVLGGARSLSALTLDQVEPDGHTSPFCHLPAQTSFEIGGGIGFDFINGPHFTSGINFDYFHNFSSILADRYAISSTWKVVF